MDLVYFLAGTVADPNFCEKTWNIWQFVGWIFTFFKIVIPLLLIIFGMVDLGKAVISSKEDEIKKSTTSLMRRAIAAVVIFFIPAIVGLIIGLVNGNDTAWDRCRDCLTDPGKDTCKAPVAPTPTP